MQCSPGHLDLQGFCVGVLGGGVRKKPAIFNGALLSKFTLPQGNCRGRMNQQRGNPHQCCRNPDARSGRRSQCSGLSSCAQSNCALTPRRPNVQGGDHKGSLKSKGSKPAGGGGKYFPVSGVKRNQALSKTCLSLRTQAGPNLDFNSVS